jgi:hypothetical protein
MTTWEYTNYSATSGDISKAAYYVIETVSLRDPRIDIARKDIRINHRLDSRLNAPCPLGDIPQ